MYKYSIIILSVMLLCLTAVQALDMGDLPVQSGGRVKPFDTLARESLQSIYGRQKFKGQPAQTVVWSWFLAPQAWHDVPLFHISYFELRQVLELKNKHATWQQLVNNNYLPTKLQQLKQKQNNNEKLKPFDQAVQNLEYNMQLFAGLQSGAIINLEPRASLNDVPPKIEPPTMESTSNTPPHPSADNEATTGIATENNQTAGSWRSVNQLTPATQKLFRQVAQSFVRTALRSTNLKANSNTESNTESILDSKKNNPISGASTSLHSSVKNFIQHLQSTYATDYAYIPRIQIEVLYNKGRPFLWAWILYLLGVLLMWAAKGRSFLYKYSLAASATGFALHIVGLLARVYIVQRPPVTNMYETVVWVALGAMGLAFYLQHRARKKQGPDTAVPQAQDSRHTTGRLVMLAGGMLSTLCLILTDLSAQVLDARLDPLEPVLRDNFWLLTHVLVITLSYAAFFLAMVVGHILLWGLLKHLRKIQASSKQDAQEQDALASQKPAALGPLPVGGVNLIYQLVKVGVVLLSVGIILGGLWADVSWGRFWGWDPKETWALIALLGYIAWLHGRMTGWLRAFGQVVGVIVAFNLVIMAWYGVNFVLGAGLHTYGFGAGGLEWVLAFVVLQLMFVLYVVWQLGQRLAR